MRRTPARVVRELVAQACADTLDTHDPLDTHPPARLVLEVDGAVPKSLNAFMGRSRWAWRGEKARWVRRLRDAWLAATIRGAARWPTPPRRPVRVTIERITARENALDPDNAIGSAKPALDALRHLQLLADDTAAALSLTVRQPKQPKTRRTRITLEMD